MAGLDLRPAFSSMLAAFGLPAVVTRPVPDNDPITTSGIWVAPIPEDLPVGLTLQRQDPLKVFALPLADVPTMPRGTVIVAAETLGGTDVRWLVDGESRREFDHVRVIVVAAAEDA
jgi:hypothetical protein